jgi:hypothetical protein
MKKLSVILASVAIGLVLVGCRIGGDDSSGGSGNAGSGGNGNGGGTQQTTKGAPPEPAKTKAKPGVPAEPAALTGDGEVPNGSTQTLRGSGFGYGEDVRLTFENTGTPSVVRTADDSGAFRYQLAIRSGPGQTIIAHATGKTSGRSASFTYTLT